MDLVSAKDWQTFHAVQNAGLHTLFWTEGFLDGMRFESFRLCVHAGLEEPDNAVALAAFVQSNHKLRRLKLCARALHGFVLEESKRLEDFFSGLTNGTVQHTLELELDFNDVPLEMEHLKAIFSSPRINSLRIDGMGSRSSLDSDSIDVLIKALNAISSLKNLQLWFFSLGETNRWSPSMLEGIVRGNSSLTDLTCELGSIDSKQAMELATAFKSNSTLTTLHLDESGVCAVGASMLASVLRDEDCSLKTLLLESVEDGSVGKIAEALKINTSLVEIDFGYSLPRVEEAFALADALRINRTLEILGLPYNQFSDEGLISLSGALLVNTTLRSLDLGVDNTFGAMASLALAESMKSNHSITFLLLRGENDEANESISEALRRNYELRKARRLISRAETSTASTTLIPLVLSRCAPAEFVDVTFLALKTFSRALGTAECSRKRKNTQEETNDCDHARRKWTRHLQMLREKAADFAKAHAWTTFSRTFSLTDYDAPSSKPISKHRREALAKLKAADVDLDDLPEERGSSDWHIVKRELALTPMQLMALKRLRVAKQT